MIMNMTTEIISLYDTRQEGERMPRGIGSLFLRIDKTFSCPGLHSVIKFIY